MLHKCTVGEAQAVAVCVLFQCKRVCGMRWAVCVLCCCVLLCQCVGASAQGVGGARAASPRACARVGGAGGVCVPPCPVNYADVRTRVARAYDEKAYEMLRAMNTLQSLSRQTAELIADVEKHCG